ncbi:MAG: hypothetical protein KY464_07955 [Gemmatimonadetes bacterium]|nr:hypothetical protein [Gemmatimonadota bacterium]
MRRYRVDYDRAYSRRPTRATPGNSYYGYGAGGFYGYNIDGRRGYGADYLSAWGPGGWSREHGREMHGRPPEPPRGGRYDRGYGRLPWWRDDGAPTG